MPTEIAQSREFQEKIRHLTHNTDGSWRSDAPEMFREFYAWLLRRPEKVQTTIRTAAWFVVLVREISLFQAETGISVDPKILGGIVYSFGERLAPIVPLTRSNPDCKHYKQMKDELYTLLCISFCYLERSMFRLFPEAVREFYADEQRFALDDRDDVAKKVKEFTRRDVSVSGQIPYRNGGTWLNTLFSR